MLELPVDPGRLFDSGDQHYLAWLGDLVQRVVRQRRRENEKQKRQSKRGR